MTDFHASDSERIDDAEPSMSCPYCSKEMTYDDGFRCEDCRIQWDGSGQNGERLKENE